MIVTCNTDQPGVIGQVGTILGRHGVNIATFALGRDGDRAVGVVIVDEPEDTPVPEVGRRRAASGEGDPRSANRPGLSPQTTAEDPSCYDSPCTLFRSVILSNERHRSPQSQSFPPGTPRHDSRENHSQKSPVVR